jgi:C-methyltransferase-like protein/putative zinc binding protein/methyltransferase family protein
MNVSNDGSGVRQVVECRVCGGSDWQEVIDFGLHPLSDNFLDRADFYEQEPYFPLAVISCRSCRLMSLTHVVDPEILYRNYAYVTSPSETMKEHVGYVARTCKQRFAMPADSLVVEMGSNVGTQLLAFRDVGMRTLGVDPARNLAVIANAEGIETLPEFFSAASATQIAKEYGPARLILGRHVFAHIDDIDDIATGVRKLLADDGVFAIEMPYALDLLEKNEFDTIYHEHLSYFLVKPLVTLFARHGLRVVDIERLPVHGGAMLVFVAPQDGPWEQRPVVAEMLELEERSGVYQDGAYEDFARVSMRVRDEVTSLVRSLVADGKRIAGYGAPAKGNTLLNACGLGPADLEFCADTTDIKHGKVTPGTHIPVHSPEYGRQHAPDYFLMLAWNYADEILRKERPYLDAGGKFIMPIPTPTIVS